MDHLVEGELVKEPGVKVEGRVAVVDGQLVFRHAFQAALDIPLTPAHFIQLYAGLPRWHGGEVWSTDMAPPAEVSSW